MYRQTFHAFSLALADEVPEPELLPEAEDPDRAGNAFSAAYADPAAALYTGEAIASPAMARKMEVDFIFRTVRGFYISGGGLGSTSPLDLQVWRCEFNESREGTLTMKKDLLLSTHGKGCVE